MQNIKLSDVLKTALDKKDVKMKTQDLKIQLVKIVEPHGTKEINWDTAEVIEEFDYKFIFASDRDKVELETLMLGRFEECYLDAVISEEDNDPINKVFHIPSNIFNPNNNGYLKLNINSLFFRFDTGLDYTYTLRVFNVSDCGNCPSCKAKKKGKK